jgi:hypothetical protein
VIGGFVGAWVNGYSRTSYRFDFNGIQEAGAFSERSFLR